MKISVIITAYNHERFIQTALKSALTQTRPADEVIVIDDASTDRTASVIATTLQSYPKEPVSFIRNEANLGVTGSVAKAVAAVSGDVIVFMSGDDVSEPGRLGRCLAHFESHPAAMAIITNAHVIDESSNRIGLLDSCAGRTEPVALSLVDLPKGAYFLRGRSSCGAAAAYRPEVFRFFPPISSGLYAEDDPLAFRAMLLGTCDFLPERLLGWRRHGDNLSYAGGVRRGPEMATHYRRCEAMVDQMLMDAAEWAHRNPEACGGGFENAVTDLRFRKHRWSLWSVAHEEGISLRGFLAAARRLLAHSPTIRIFAREAWRPLVGLVTPFPLQRLLSRL
jgi:glycosyltransferase involved in cell wall biosynthesis